MSDLICYLIEAPGPAYLQARQLRLQADIGWTADHNKALRFVDREAAQALMDALRTLLPELFPPAFIFAPRVVEHKWIDLE